VATDLELAGILPFNGFAKLKIQRTIYERDLEMLTKDGIEQIRPPGG